MEPPEASSEELKQIEKERTEQLEKIGERSVSRFEPAGIAALLRSHGFCAKEYINFQEIVSRFGGAVQGLALGHLGCFFSGGGGVCEMAAAGPTRVGERIGQELE